MDPRPASEIEAELRRRLAELAEADRATREDRAPVTLDPASIGRLSRADALQRQAMAQAAAARRILERRRIEAALERLARGTWGECARCGEPIEPARLALDPAIPFCRACAERDPR